MNLSELQKAATALIAEYDKRHSGKHDSDTVLAHLVEEFGEIGRELYNEKSGRDKLDLKNLAGEIADVYLLLAQLADNYDIEIETAVTEKLKELKGRK